MSIERGLLLTAIAFFGLLAVLMVLPYEQYLLLAILLAYLLYPLQRRLRGSIGPRFSAGIIIVGAFLAVVVPVGVFLGVAIRQAISLLNTISRGEFNAEVLEGILSQRAGVAIDIERPLSQSGFDASRLLQSSEGGNPMSVFGNVTEVLTGLVSVLGSLTDIAIGLTVFLFVLYYLLVDGPALIIWLRSVSPLRTSMVDRLYQHVDRLMYAVLFGNLLVAIVQGVLVGVGFALLGISNAFLWTIATIMLALLPIIGASVVWIPTSAYLFLTGRPVTAVILFAYGALVVSLSDNYLRPVIGGREAQLNPGLFVVGIFGGLVVFGFMGIFFGPIVLGVLKALIELFSERQNHLRPAM